MPGLMRQWFDPTKPKTKVTQNITNTAPAAAGSAAVPGVAPGTSPDDFTKQQTAYYQNLLAGLGQGQPGNALPQGITENIDRQASLLGSS